MADICHQIDLIDIELDNLIVIRSRYIDRAIELKKTEGPPARTKDGVAEDLSRVAATASDRGLDLDLARAL